MNRERAKSVAAIIRGAGGKVVGHTRLQIIAFLLDRAGYGDGFRFKYKHFGPFSEEMAEATRTGVLFREVQEREQATDWGSTYSIYRVEGQCPSTAHADRQELVKWLADTDQSVIQLELVATAIFMSEKNYDSPWEETKRRKPQKSEMGRLEGAKQLFEVLRKFDVPNPLPDLA